MKREEIEKYQSSLYDLGTTIGLMDEDDLLETFQEYFGIQEVVDPETFNRHGEGAWMFVDFRLMAVVLFMRVGIGKPFHVNNYTRGGSFDERGLRSNISNIASTRTKKGQLYLSAHTMGKALDFHINGMPATDVRDWARKNAEYFPYKARFENLMHGKPIGWVHVDCFYRRSNKQVEFFNV